MKQWILTSVLMLMASSLSYAAKTHHTNITMAFGAPVIVHNDSNSDIAYSISSNSIFNDNIYGIKVGRADVYHAGTGDTRATVYAGNCSALGGNGLICHKVEGRSLVNCVKYAHYNMNLVDSIHINSPNACTVTCVDGSKDSCIVP